MTSKRIQYLEYLRVISMFCVTLIHSCITAITDFSEYSNGTYAGVFFYTVRNICHFAVPIFFMISGALFLEPNKDITIEKLLKKYVSKYLMLIFIFGWGFAFAEEIFTHRSFAVIYLITSFKNMFEGNSWNHMWYLYELVGILLIVPILRILVKKLTNNEQKYIEWILFLFLSVFPIISKIFRIEIGIRFSFKSIYVLYVLLGHWLFRRKNTFKNSVCILLIVMAIGGCIFDSYLYIMKNIDIGLASYSSPIIVLMACAIFVLAKNTVRTKDNILQNKLIPFFSNLSLGVYIIHMLWINLIYKVFNVNPFVSPVLMLIGIWGIVTGLAVATTLVMKKVPLIKQIV